MFSEFVKTLPDNGTGEYVDRFYYQNYSTDLNETEADSIAALSFVYFVDKIEAPPFADGLEELDISQHSLNSMQEHHRRETLPHPSNINLNIRIPSADHLRLISQASGADLNLPYAFDSSLGAGTTIYIIDTGINIDHAVGCACFSGSRSATNIYSGIQRSKTWFSSKHGLCRPKSLHDA
jgi:subtilisin family serine protease